MVFLYYLIIGIIYYLSTVSLSTLKEKLPAMYIAYRCEEIAKGVDYFKESTFRKIFVIMLVLLFVLGWPYIIAKRIYRAIFK